MKITKGSSLVLDLLKIPTKPHPNCKCYLVEIDKDGQETGNRHEPDEWKNDNKENSRDKDKKKEDKDKQKDDDKKDKKPCAIPSSPFGKRDKPTSRASGDHKGFDFKVPEGTPVQAVHDGVVYKSGAQDPNNLKKGFGYRVMIQHPDGGFTIYGHLKDHPSLEKGDIVKKGDVIGYSGNTGVSTKPHLHYEIRDKTNTAFEPPQEDIDEILNNLNSHCK